LAGPVLLVSDEPPGVLDPQQPRVMPTGGGLDLQERAQLSGRPA
jgi:hypothetical protein